MMTRPMQDRMGAGPSSAAAPPSAEVRETLRVQAGREVREALEMLIKLLSARKTKEAAQALESLRAAGGRPATDALAKKRPGELQDLIFTFGNDLR